MEGCSRAEGGALVRLGKVFNYISAMFVQTSLGPSVE